MFKHRGSNVYLEKLKQLCLPIFSRRFLRFCAVGGSGVFVNLCSFFVFKKLNLHVNLASALAIELSIVSNFLMNYFWTFRDRSPSGGLAHQALRFHLVSLIGGTMQFLVFVVMNMIWLVTRFDGETITAYHGSASSWTERWMWHPFVAPPRVGGYDYLSQLAGIAVATIWNFLANFHWTWRVRADDESP